MKQDITEFYIGWQQAAPDKLSHFIIKTSFALLVLVVLVASGFVIFQRDFSKSVFEYGRDTTLTGILTTAPVPMLTVSHGMDVTGQMITQQILLVGAGKQGAEKQIKASIPAAILQKDGVEVTLSGYLIYHDGQVLLEVRDIQATGDTPNTADPVMTITGIAEGTISGQLADPKCFFGVMKPGDGKPHLSCAARCIAGGIPPVLKNVNATGATQYFILVGHDGLPVNEMVLPYVGEHLFVRGKIKTSGDWQFIYLQDKNAITSVPGSLAYQSLMCKAFR
jgi:hypothetical protein